MTFFYRMGQCRHPSCLHCQADGIASRLRALTFGTIARAYSGAMAWRSVALSRPLGPPAAPPNELEDIDAGMTQTPQQHGSRLAETLESFSWRAGFTLTSHISHGGMLSRDH